MAKLIIRRADTYINRRRKFKLFINDEEHGVIQNGETREFDLPAGSYSIRTTVDWCSSPKHEVLLDDNGAKYVDVLPYPYANVVTIAGIVIVLGNIAMRRFTGTDYLLALGIPVFLYMFFYMTINRKKYLQLRDGDFF